MGFKNTPLLPQRDLGGETASRSPFRRELNFIETPCLPFSDGIENPALRPKEYAPLEPSLICIHEEGRKSVKSGSVPGFALLFLRPVNRARSAFHTVF